MSVDISSVAYALRKASQGTILPLSHGHSLELVCAAFGYRSLAAYKAAVANRREPSDLAEIGHIVIQHGLVLARTSELNSMAPSMQWLTMVIEALSKALPRARLHHDDGGLFDDLVELVNAAAYNDERTGSAMAMTNGQGVGEIYLPFDDVVMDELPPVGEPLDIEIEGHISMELDIERPYAGHEIDIKATLTLERLGKAVLAKPEIRVLIAKLDYDW